MSKVGVSGVIKVDAYGVVARAVEEGISAGWRRAYKHSEVPPEANVRSVIGDAVMVELCEVLRFGVEEESK